MFLVYNSDIVATDAFRVSANDRAFQYGDGLFETIRYQNGTVWFWPDHLSRLQRGMAALQLIPPASFDPVSLGRMLRQLLTANNLLEQTARIKIQVWRQAGGLYTPENRAANYLISCRPGHDFGITERTKVGIYTDFKLVQSPVSSYKTVNALPYVLAGIFKQDQGLDDVLLLSQEGHLAECIASNLFWFRAGVLHTPALQTGCIDGIARRQLLRAFPNSQQGLFNPAELDLADTVFAANVMGVQVFKGHFTPQQHDQITYLFTQSPA